MAKENLITLEFEDGEIQELEIEGTFEVAGQEYIALLSKETPQKAGETACEEVYLFRYNGNENSGFEVTDIESDEEFEKISAVYDGIMEKK